MTICGVTTLKTTISIWEKRGNRMKKYIKPSLEVYDAKKLSQIRAQASSCNAGVCSAGLCSTGVCGTTTY